MSEEMRFGFGKNWEDYIKKNLNEERIEISRKHTLDFMGLEDLKGKTFLDIGCGSGLHSLAAFRSGAERIFSFDFDNHSVLATNFAKKYAGNPENWSVTQGSILDDEFVSTIEPADIVYSWGVLHHTGDMWKAMDNTAKLAKKGSLLYIALYDYEIQVNPTADFWLEVKQKYNRASWFGKRSWEWWYVWNFMMYRKLSNLSDVFDRAFRYKDGEGRGMALYTDIKDWLGGWPMEFAKRPDVKAWADRHGLEMLIMKTGKANTEYLFKRN